MKDINSLVNTAVAMEIGEPERDVVPVGGYAVASLIGVHRYVVQRVGPTQPVNEDMCDHAPSPPCEKQAYQYLTKAVT